MVSWDCSVAVRPQEQSEEGSRDLLNHVPVGVVIFYNVLNRRSWKILQLVVDTIP